MMPAPALASMPGLASMPSLASMTAMLSAGEVFGQTLAQFDIGLAERADNIAQPNILEADAGGSGIRSEHGVMPAATQSDSSMADRFPAPSAALTSAAAWLSSMSATSGTLQQAQPSPSMTSLAPAAASLSSISATSGTLQQAQPSPSMTSLAPAAASLSSISATSATLQQAQPSPSMTSMAPVPSKLESDSDMLRPTNVEETVETAPDLYAELTPVGTPGPERSRAADTLTKSEEDSVQDADASDAQANGLYMPPPLGAVDVKPNIALRKVRSEEQTDTTRMPGIQNGIGLRSGANLARRGDGAPVFAARTLDGPDRSLPTAVPEQMRPLANNEPVFALSDMSPALSNVRGTINAFGGGLQALASAQAVTDRQLNLARDSLWLDQLATDIVAASDTADHISFRLMPPHLGRLDVDLTTSSAGLTVNIATSSEEAGRIVSSAQTGLVESLHSQGVRVADTYVTSSNDMSRQGQSQRHHPATLPTDPILSATDESIDQHEDRPDGRFA